MNYEEIKIPSSFSETVQLVESYALEQIQQQTEQKQLYYHTVTHAIAVKRRAQIIFQVIRPSLETNSNSQKLDRIANLIDLCATAHDLVQEILPATEVNSSRKRPVRVSEIATINKLTEYIKNLNQRLSKQNINDSAKFNDLDIHIIKEAIEATICELDPFSANPNSGLSPNSIYQPYLYNSNIKLSLVANIIALADLGTLGMEGIEPYLHEGILIFLEENPDLVKLISTNNYIDVQSEVKDHQHKDIIKKRLLNMTRFMVNLAKDRQVRFKQEITVFPEKAQNILQHKVFQYLNINTINKIEELTPTDENNSLTELLAFFHMHSNLRLSSTNETEILTVDC